MSQRALPDWRDEILDRRDDFDDFGPYGDIPAPRYGGDSFADELLDDVIPANLDWRGLVVRHPVPILAAVALGGFLVGRLRGRAVLAAAAGFAAERVSRGMMGALAQRADAIEDDEYED
jgi:hypothetical protein